MIEYTPHTLTNVSMATLRDFLFGKGSVGRNMKVDKFLLYDPLANESSSKVKVGEGGRNIDNMFNEYNLELQAEWREEMDNWLLGLKGDDAVLKAPLIQGTVFNLYLPDVDRDIVTTLGNQLIEVNNFPLFISKQLKLLSADKKYEAVYKKRREDGLGVRNIDLSCSVWIWSRAQHLSKVENANKNDTSSLWSKPEYLITKENNTTYSLEDVSPDVISLNTQILREGGFFTITLPPIIGEFSKEKNKWEKKGGKGENVFEGDLYNKNERRSLYYERIIQENDLVFIRFERLEIEKDRQAGLGKGEVDAKELQFKTFDMIGLVDSCNSNHSSTGNNVSITVSGRDLTKLLVEDGVYFYAFDFISGGIFANEVTEDRVKRFDGQLKSKFQFSFKNIDSVLKFIFNNLGNIEIVPNALFSAYGSGGVDKNPLFDISGKMEKERRTVNVNTLGEEYESFEIKPQQGIWQIIKLLVDRSVHDRIVVSSDVGNEHGALMNAIKKIAQEPFIEFFGDTYGDQYYFTCRTPPFNGQKIKEYLRDESIISIDSEDILSDNLRMGGEAYSWYRLQPQSIIPGSNDKLSFAYLRAIYLKEYAERWGAKPYDQVSNYIPYINLVDEKTVKENAIFIQQGYEDLKWMIETTAYLPFVKRGTITINPDRRIKRGTWIRLNNTGEVFYIVGVINDLYVADNSVDRVTILNVERGMVEKYIWDNYFNYFNIVNLSRVVYRDLKEGEISSLEKLKQQASQWRVIPEVFNFFTQQKQFIR